MTIGELIRKERKRADMSTKDLSKRAGISVRALQRLEHSEISSPLFLTVAWIAKALNLSLDEIADKTVYYSEDSQK